MVELIWNFLATFRNRCRERAREIVKTECRDIFPDQAQFRGRDDWIEKGNVDNLMHPVFARLAQTILSMGRRPLGQEFPEEFRKYRPKFITSIMIFFRSIEEWRTGVFVSGQLREAYYQGYYIRGFLVGTHQQTRDLPGSLEQDHRRVGSLS
ncbi:hypothetical protein K438DRAFT_1756751 [Mycena galopus ATCC 62051]|nr:hypothetical protein K438DRAFT_1756751 [Mycena galopus ATCC 62051]